jgi:predicted transglutaminase-like cysteine proteinase
MEQGSPMSIVSPRRNGVLGAVVFIVAVAGSSAAFAGAQSSGPASGPARMPTGATAAPPSGFLDFCERSPRDCVAPGEQANFAEIRARANSLYWADVFGRPRPVAASRPAATMASNGFDWSRVFPQRAAALSAVPDPLRDGAAVAMEDVAAPAVDVIAVQTGATGDQTAPSAEDFGRNVSARIRDLPRPRMSDPIKAAPVITVSDTDWKAIADINRNVNRQIRSGSDARVYGVGDYWTVPQGDRARGDCEDFVLAKRRALVRAGYPVGALSIAIVETRWGEVHAVLLVATDRGDYVLDNLTGRIVRWDQVSYRWRERQAPGKTFEWVRMAA